MKKTLALLLALSLMLALCACASTEKESPATPAQPQETQAAAPAATEQTAEPAPAPADNYPAEIINVVIPTDEGGAVDRAVQAFTSIWSKKLGAAFTPARTDRSAMSTS